MEKAKQYIQEQQEDLKDLRESGYIPSDEELERQAHQLVLDVNNIVWTYSKENITLDEAQSISMCIQDMLYNPKRYLIKQ